MCHLKNYIKMLMANLSQKIFFLKIGLRKNVLTFNDNASIQTFLSSHQSCWICYYCTSSCIRSPGWSYNLLKKFPFAGTIQYLVAMISHNVVDLLVRHHQVSTLIPAPSISSSISTKPVELLVALRILSASSNKNRKRLKLSCNFYLQICSAPPSVHRTKIHSDKGCHSPSITIKQWNQHAVPNRYPKHNQAKMTIHYSFRHVYVLTGIAKMHVASLSLYIYI